MNDLASTLHAATPWIVVGAFLALFAAEHLRPLRRWRRPLAPRVAVNAGMTALALGCGALLVTPVALSIAALTQERRFGLLAWLDLPPAAEAGAAFLLLDLTFYHWHRLNHVVPWLWRFHNAHHIDPDLDATTAFRFHFGEVLYSTAFRAVQVGLLGVSPAAYMLYAVVFQTCTVFHHSNLRLPIRLEQMLNGVFVTPRMHGIHHSFVPEETNANYSVVFSWWDRLHRSLALSVPQAAVEIGVPGYAKPEDNRLWAALALPFRRQRPYWERPDGSRPQRDRPAGSAPPARTLAE